MTYIKEPMAIEIKSFEIIESIVAENNWHFPSEDPVERNIYKRVIHTSADFDYLENLKISSDFIFEFNRASTRKITVYTDTNMVLAGINKTAFSKLPWTLKCFVADEEVKRLAESLGITRSMAAIQMAAKEPGEKLFVIGNAPTAIFQILESLEAFDHKIVGIIGVPVGFVGAEESKQALYESGLTHITALGKKGGSNVAAAIVNALMYAVTGREA